MLASWGLGNPELGVVMLALFVVFIMFGFPIAFTLMALGFGFGYFAMGDIVFALVVQRAYSVMTNDTLIAIPLFVFMGYIIERANILDRLFNAIQIAVGGHPRLAGGGHAPHLRPLRHRHGHRRRGGHPHGPPGFPGHAARGL
jgi:TRAP-type mannitol/chloroaromatic compound transport system permease large subunit